MHEFSIDVIIPSVGRPDDALAAAKSVQAAIAHARALKCNANVLIVHRRADEKTRDAALEAGARPVAVREPGLAQAMRAGAAASSADIVAFMDDDARMRDDWLHRLLPHYEDPKILGVGGLDVQPNGFPVRVRQADIGKIDRLGRVIGGHHQAAGEPRLVHHLKGANCSFRRANFLRRNFAMLLAGTGAQARNEFVASLVVTEGNGHLILDPKVVVDHFPAARAEGDSRQSDIKAYETAFNEAFGFAYSLHKYRRRNFVFLHLLGYRHTPGVMRIVLGGAPLSLVLSSIRGCREGRQAGLRARRLNERETALENR